MEMWTGTEALEADLAAAPTRLQADLAGVVSKGCLNIKNDWRGRTTGLAHAPAYPYSITYDVDVQPGRIAGEVGPDKTKRQGALGNLLEFGSVHNPPRLDGAGALAAEEPRFLAACADVAAAAVFG